ncbi:hypothetical protein STRCI_001343 [Streptomyces cinnabarinus]|uniref:Uncharacterized protein n=1 Tax=Streptomyces cinnabarinus TaxID=67287 RepID=A0ABY7KAS7_9ACTN|nr:hypothetical protein [Streptomyces cinnabarinus]WAZ20242.1 hypothetical protein STRCI_001343 [Streptomyces cinnabarinus]
MTIDRPDTRLDFRGTVDTSEQMAGFLDSISEKWPDLQPVTHKDHNTYGVVRDDSPANVPGHFDGKPRRVCLDYSGETWVSVVWNPGGAVPLRCWVPARRLTTCGRRY